MHTHDAQMESDSFCSSFVEHFCRGEPAMGVEFETNLCRAVLAEPTQRQRCACEADYFGAFCDAAASRC